MKPIMFTAVVLLLVFAVNANSKDDEFEKIAKD